MATFETQLTCMMLEPGTSQVQQGNDGSYMFTETWKGPWTSMKDFAKTHIIMDQLLVIGMKRPTFNAQKWKREIAPSDKYSLDPWVLTGIDVKEITAGNHGELTLTWSDSGSFYNTDGGTGEGGAEIAPISSDSYQQENQGVRQWNITWQEYNRSMLQYFQPNLASEIVNYKNYQIGAYTYTNAEGTLSASLPADAKTRLGATWYKNDIQAIAHYPVVSYHQEYYLPEGHQVHTAIGADLDKKCELPNECPFKEQLTAWEWIQIADEGTISRSGNQLFRGNAQAVQGIEAKMFKYSRDTKWRGAKKWADELYGQNKWEPV